MNKYSIYADGAYSSARDQQGFSFVVYEELEGGKRLQKHLFYNGLCGGTNIRAEMNACLSALKYISENNITDEVTIFTDSMQIIGTFTKNWKMNKNTDMWPSLWKLITPNIHFQHVKGHEGDEGNSLVDKWAVFGSQLMGCGIDIRIEPTKILEEDIKTNDLTFKF